MESQNPIEKELNELESEMLVSKVSQGYAVPAGYFEGLATQVLSRIQNNTESPATELEQLSPLLHSISKANVYAVPQGYFDETPLLPSLDAGEEIAAISPLLAGISREMPYALPEKYFETVERIKPEAKVVSIKKNNWRKYAAAAAIVLAVLTSGLLFSNRKTVSSTDPLSLAQKEIKQLDEGELSDWVIELDMEGGSDSDLMAGSAVPVSDILKNMSESEINNFIEINKDLDFLFDIN